MLDIRKKIKIKLNIINRSTDLAANVLFFPFRQNSLLCLMGSSLSRTFKKKPFISRSLFKNIWHIPHLQGLTFKTSVLIFTKALFVPKRNNVNNDLPVINSKSFNRHHKITVPFIQLMQQKHTRIIGTLLTWQKCFDDNAIN